MDLIQTNKVLQRFGKLSVERAQLELSVDRRIRGRKVRRVATSNLMNSLYYQVFQRREQFRVEFGASGTAGRYAGFIHEGVNGRDVNVGSPYSFKKRFVNIGAIKEWMENKPVALRDYKTGRFIAKTEKNKNRAAFMIARSVASKGIVPIPFFDLGVEYAYERMKKELAEALTKDSIKILTK